MELNKKKSAIPPFAPRTAKDVPKMMPKDTTDQKKRGVQWELAQADVCKIPIVNQCKYLGMLFDCKLTMKPQLEKILYNC